MPNRASHNSRCVWYAGISTILLCSLKNGSGTAVAKSRSASRSRARSTARVCLSSYCIQPPVRHSVSVLCFTAQIFWLANALQELDSDDLRDKLLSPWVTDREIAPLFIPVCTPMLGLELKCAVHRTPCRTAYCGLAYTTERVGVPGQVTNTRLFSFLYQKRPSHTIPFNSYSRSLLLSFFFLRVL